MTAQIVDFAVAKHARRVAAEAAVIKARRARIADYARFEMPEGPERDYWLRVCEEDPTAMAEALAAR